MHVSLYIFNFSGNSLQEEVIRGIIHQVFLTKLTKLLSNPVPVPASRRVHLVRGRWTRESPEPSLHQALHLRRQWRGTLNPCPSVVSRQARPADDFQLTVWFIAHSV
ncbi:hypothetical protein VTL71DRAFT_15128 [Oculimacula yallundae]|uniref:Uncharacterized protein n=1 Tax=Oculimacula yallundae TaxID=86028 RepID=A0ABR4CFP8_9HELO